MNSLFSPSNFEQPRRVYSNSYTTPFGAKTSFKYGTLFNTELLSFEVETSQRHALIHWSTFLQDDYFLFTIERSQDCIAWEEIHQIESGTNSMAQSLYAWIDDTPCSNVSYYRLKIVDSDGDLHYSPTKSFNSNNTINSAELLVYPNPAVNTVTVEGNTNDLDQLTILDASGNDISDRASIEVSNSNSLEIDVSSLARGLYYLKTPTNLVRISKI